MVQYISILLYSCYLEKGLVYIIITALSSYQPSFYSKYTKLNINLSYNIYFIFNAECMHPYSLYSL
jgi:hypothetical protein